MDPDRVGYWIDLAGFLIADVGRSGDLSELGTAIDMLRAATAAPSPHLAAGLVRLGDALGRQYETDGRAEMLDEMVAVDERLVAFTKPGDPERAQRMFNLAYGLRRQYTTRGDTAALDE